MATPAFFGPIQVRDEAPLMQLRDAPGACNNMVAAPLRNVRGRRRRSGGRKSAGTGGDLLSRQPAHPSFARAFIKADLAVRRVREGLNSIGWKRAAVTA